jgi:hypothetical protein
MSAVKTCPKCQEAKSLDKFYASANGTRMTYCKKCDNARPRKATNVKVNRMRARHRAIADLIQWHPDDFQALLAIRLAEATEEAEELAATPEAKEHAAGGPVKLKPGKRMPGEKAGDRIDVARCPHCIKSHDRGHVCASCGASPEPSNKKLVTGLRSVEHPKPAPSGVRRAVPGIDMDALAEFNKGTERARGAR